MAEAGVRHVRGERSTRWAVSPAALHSTTNTQPFVPRAEIAAVQNARIRGAVRTSVNRLSPDRLPMSTGNKGEAAKLWSDVERRGAEAEAARLVFHRRAKGRSQQKTTTSTVAHRVLGSGLDGGGALLNQPRPMIATALISIASSGKWKGGSNNINHTNISRRVGEGSSSIRVPL